MTSAPRRIELHRRARREIETIDAWWRTHRPLSPDAFLGDVEHAFEALLVHPGLGAQARSTRIVGVRRILLPRTHHHLYYRVAGEVIQVLAVWHASRGRPPGL